MEAAEIWFLLGPETPEISGFVPKFPGSLFREPEMNPEISGFPKVELENPEINRKFPGSLLGDTFCF